MAHCAKNMLLLLASLGLLGGLRLTSTTTTTTFVAAMSMANQDLERYFRTINNSTQTLSTIAEERFAMDLYTYAYLNYSYRDEHNETIPKSYKEEKARFGEGRVFDVHGKLVHITDADESGLPVVGDYACTAHILGTRGDPTPTDVTWIALVRRGRCTFEEKVKNVYAKGARGVIIFNDKPVMNLEKMQIKGKNRNITAVITYQEIGLDMAHLLDIGYNLNASIVEGRSGMRPINTLNRTSVLFVSISFIVLMIISLVWLIFYYIQRFRYLQSKDQQSRHLCSVTKKAIMKIPTKTGKASDEKDMDSDCCAICIEAYKNSDCIRVLPCKHEFHKNCIDPWLIEHRTCPMCKLDVLKFYGYVFIESEESILEIFDADRNRNATAVVPAVTNSMALPHVAAAVGDIVRSREFVVGFPRILVLQSGSTEQQPWEYFNDNQGLFPPRLPERTQSTLTLADHARDWMSVMSNKLEEQQGMRRARKTSTQCEMKENLLDPRDSTRKRRSRSADGRFLNANRKELKQLEIAKSAADANASTTRDDAPRRGSSALRLLTDAAYAQSIQRRRQELVRRRSSAFISHEDLQNVRVDNVAEAAGVSGTNGAGTTVSDVGSVRIQINGEGVEL